VSAVLDFLVGAALVVGLFFHTMGVLGILRFPDVYTRLHADTKATTFGSIFIALASVIMAIRYGAAAASGEGGAWANVAVHIAFAVVVLLVTNATGGHAIARAAWRAGHRPAVAVVDALAAEEKGAAETTGTEGTEETAETAGMGATETTETTETTEIAGEVPVEPVGEETRLEAASPEATAPEGAAQDVAAPEAEAPKGTLPGWAAVVGITAEEPLGAEEAIEGEEEKA
jgi:multicomponent Na+:H+ antiporter subunit G